MIKANELRIGNWFDFFDLPWEAEGVTIREQLTQKHFWHGQEYEFSIETSLQPIPLTPEILKKAGFDTADYEIDIIIWDYKDKFIICQNGQPVEDQPFVFEWDNGDKDIETEIKYVHQLQNLFFALTGEELEINLQPSTAYKQQ